jgi:hypothetical protein
VVKGKLLLTALSLVLDGSNCPLVPPVDGPGQLLDAVVAVPLPGRAAPPDGVGAEVVGAELVVGEIGEGVHAEAVSVVVGAGVVRVDEPEVVPEDAEAAVALAERVVVGAAVLREPEVVHGPRLLLGARLQPPRAVLLVVGDDGHVGGRGGGREEEGDEDGEAPAESHGYDGGGGRDERPYRLNKPPSLSLLLSLFAQISRCGFGGLNAALIYTVDRKKTPLWIHLVFFPYLLL